MADKTEGVLAERRAQEVQHAITRSLILKQQNKLFESYSRIFDPAEPTKKGAYQWQADFHNAGSSYTERAIMAGNRCGKTSCAAAEIACHLTGKYPEWWTGRKFNEPVQFWVAGETNETTRDVIQEQLLGVEGSYGTGWVPAAHLIDKPKYRQAGVNNVVDQFYVKHSSGGVSTCSLKCHPAGQRALLADGRWKPVEHIVVGDMLRCADGVDRPVTQTHAYLDAPIMEIVTRAGNIRGTPNHPVFTQRGKLRMDELVLGDVLEIANTDCGTKKVEDWRVVWTALMIGDGCLRAATPLLSCAEPEILEQAQSFLPDDLYVTPAGSATTIDWKVSSRLHKRNRLKESLVNDGLWGKKSWHKFIPEWVFTLCREQRILFLRWLWTTDGYVTGHLARYDSTSRTLVDDVRALLWSVGIRGKVNSRPPVNPRYGDRNSIELSGHERIAFEEIGKINRNNKNGFKYGPRPQGPRGEVLAIKHLEPRPVYGAGVPDVHELVVEGFRVGNTYEQGVDKWRGKRLDGVWLDEEPAEQIYVEARTRILDRKGILILTATPHKGKTWVIRHFMESERNKGIYYKNVTWDDAPHLDKEAKEELWNSYPVHERKTRAQGIPMMGIGAVFPIDQERIVVDPFQLKPYWPRINGADFGIAHPFGFANCAIDRDSDTFYVYDTYAAEGEIPVVHAVAMKKHGDWIPCAWPRDGLQRDKGSGQQLKDQYRNHGVYMLKEHAHYKDERGEHVEPGLLEMYEFMRAGKFKVFRGTGERFLEEMRNYHRDEDGKLVKERDDVISAVRYAFMMRRYARTHMPRLAQNSGPSVPIIGRR